MSLLPCLKILLLPLTSPLFQTRLSPLFSRVDFFPSLSVKSTSSFSEAKTLFLPQEFASHCLPVMGDSAKLSERAALTLRTIPTMTMSRPSNPLTAPPQPLYPAMSATDRASARFAVKGNAIITGGAGALALPTARALLEHGASGIALLDLKATLVSSHAAIKQLRSDFPEATIVDLVCDVTSDQVPAVMKAAAIALSSARRRTSGSSVQAEPRPARISMLLCFAGIVGCYNSLSQTADQFRKVIDVNLTGAFLCAKAAAQYMMPPKAGNPVISSPSDMKGGRIVFIASISGRTVNFPQPQAGYNASKAGLLHLKSSLAAELACYGIRVNSVSPGYMDTVLNAGDNLKNLRDIWAGRCPMGRMGDVEELTGAVVMLCSERAGSFINGADIVVDGGTTCF